MDGSQLDPQVPELDDTEPGTDDDGSLLTHDGDASEPVMPRDDDGPGIPPAPPD